jgi:cell division protein FtsZ
VVDEILKQVIKGITDIINSYGLVNVDLADLKMILKNAGQVLLGIGTAEGEGRAIEAIKQAVENPFSDLSLKGAKGLLFIVAGGSDLTMYEVNEMLKYIRELINPNCQVIFGAIIDELMQNKVKVTIIATGFSPNTVEKSQTSVLIKPQSILEKKIEIENIQSIQNESEIKTKITNIDKNFSESDLEIPAFLRKNQKFPTHR